MKLKLLSILVIFIGFAGNANASVAPYLKNIRRFLSSYHGIEAASSSQFKSLASRLMGPGQEIRVIQSPGGFKELAKEDLDNFLRALQSDQVDSEFFGQFMERIIAFEKAYAERVPFSLEEARKLAIRLSNELFSLKSGVDGVVFADRTNFHLISEGVRSSNSKSYTIRLRNTRRTLAQRKAAAATSPSVEAHENQYVQAVVWVEQGVLPESVQSTIESKGLPIFSTIGEIEEFPSAFVTVLPVEKVHLIYELPHVSAVDIHHWNGLSGEIISSSL